MFVEISQMQRLIVFLGHPTYSLSVVLFSRLVSSGVGSYLTSSVEVRGALSKEVIKRVIQRHVNEVRYCYEQQLTLNPKLTGKVSIKWQINADGRASNPMLLGGDATTLPNEEVGRCIMSRIVTWEFPKPRGGGIAIVTYPWILRSSGSMAAG